MPVAGIFLDTVRQKEHASRKFMPIADLFPGLFAQFSRTAHFDEKTIAAVEKLVIKKNDKPYLKCLVRQKEVLAKP